VRKILERFCLEDYFVECLWSPGVFVDSGNVDLLSAMVQIKLKRYISAYNADSLTGMSSD
jgi:hypothetical protein